MDYATIARKLLEAGKKYAKAQIKKDGENRYSLLAEWWLPAISSDVLPPGEYHGEVVNVFSDGRQILVWYNPFTSTPDNPICDGASRFPDRFLGVNLVPGAVSHDPWYREFEAIAKAFGVAASVVRKLGDQIFTSVNLAENDGKPCVETVSTLTYWGVRLFGGIYHRRHLAGVLLLSACLLFLAGCVGTIFDDPGDYTSPQVEKVAQNGNL